MATWSPQLSYTAHKTAHPIVNAIAHRGSQPNLVLSAGSDNQVGVDCSPYPQVLLYDVSENKIARRFTGHTKSVNALLLHPTRDVVVTASDDKTIRMWVDRSCSLTRSRRGEADGLPQPRRGGHRRLAAGHRRLLRLLRPRRRLVLLRHRRRASGAARDGRGWVRRRGISRRKDGDGGVPPRRTDSRHRHGAGRRGRVGREVAELCDAV